jgi:hypothetical protein
LKSLHRAYTTLTLTNESSERKSLLADEGFGIFVKQSQTLGLASFEAAKVKQSFNTPKPKANVRVLLGANKASNEKNAKGDGKSRVWVN